MPVLAVLLAVASIWDYPAHFAPRTRGLQAAPSLPCKGAYGRSVTLEGENLSWDFDFGCFVANLNLAAVSAGGNSGDLYVNRDGGHSQLVVTNFPGLTPVVLGQEGRRRRLHQNLPNMLFPYPVFGNCSQAFVAGPNWRSIPRAVMTSDRARLRSMVKFYLSNQTWVFPSNADTPPVGTNGDVFASITPYWMTTAGRSWSDLPYVEAALRASAALPDATKRKLVKTGLLAPVLQTLIRKSLKGVTNETAYLTAAAHPTAFPPKGVDLMRLVTAAGALEEEAIPPLVPIRVEVSPCTAPPPRHPELSYSSAFAWAYVLRAEEDVRTFTIAATGASEYAFVQTHGKGVKVKIERVSPSVARVAVDRRGMTPVNRVDIMVCGRNPGTGWGAPSYLSLAVTDSRAPYSDPLLTERQKGD